MSDEHRALLRWCKVAMAMKVSDKVYAVSKMEFIAPKFYLEATRKCFIKWRDNESVRQLRLMKKLMTRWILRSSLN